MYVSSKNWLQARTNVITNFSAIVGGLILLVNMGPGGLSVDEKKKTY